jgi:F0F1-type ATP synthase membrane subunit c/vacuolar-type H+-ATPase subunit K
MAVAMNPIDMFARLMTVKDWTSFVIGLAVGVTMVFAGILRLKTFPNLDVLLGSEYR